MPAIAAFDLLKSIDIRCRRNSTGLPVATSVVDDWAGIGFAINHIPLLVSMEEVSEVLLPPATIRVPGVCHWVKGLANIRGSLMPVLDMNEFLYGYPAVIGNKSRVLITTNAEVKAALLVDEVYGLRRFKAEEQRPAVLADAGVFEEYLVGMFMEKSYRWNVFSIEKLAQTDQFLRVV